MNKGLAIAGGTLMLLSILVFFVSLVAVMGHGPDSDNILHDTETNGMTFTYDGEASLLEVYAKGDVDCYTFTVSISDEMFDYFWPNCDGSTMADGYTYLGDLEVSAVGDYTIDAEGDIVIIDADGLILPGLSFCGGGVCCLMGLILLIIGLSVGSKAPQVIVYQQPDGTMYQPNQTTVQQYVPPSGVQPIQQQFTAQPQVQEQQNIPPAFEERPNDVPVYQTDFDGFSFEHKKDD
jgi:hypothetical protein